jgi:hypothetical protein
MMVHHPVTMVVMMPPPATMPTPMMMPAPMAMPRPVIVPVPVIVPPPIVAPAPIALPGPVAMPAMMPGPPPVMPHGVMHGVMHHRLVHHRLVHHRLGRHRLRLRGRFGHRSRLRGRRRGAAAAAHPAGLLRGGWSSDQCRREQSGGQNSQHEFLLISVAQSAVLHRRAFTACWYCTDGERQMKRAGARRSSF